MAARAHFQGSICILLLFLQACAGSKSPEKMPAFNFAEIKVEMQNGLLMKDAHPFTGIIYTLQLNKKDTAEIVCFKEGREHGVWKKFYDGGQLMETRYFNNGKKEGAYYAWWPNGSLKLAYHFKDGEYNGLCREWTDHKILLKAMNYKEGYEDGHQKQFYDDGKIKANYIITDGRRYGLLGTKNCVNVTDSVFKK